MYIEELRYIRQRKFNFILFPPFCSVLHKVKLRHLLPSHIAIKSIRKKAIEKYLFSFKYCELHLVIRGKSKNVEENNKTNILTLIWALFCNWGEFKDKKGAICMILRVSNKMYLQIIGVIQMHITKTYLISSYLVLSNFRFIDFFD